MPVVDPYKAGMFTANPYAKKYPVSGELVVVLQGKLEGRSLSLITPPSRALLKNEIHELILTDEDEAAPGKTVNRIAYLGFFKVEKGSVIVKGDPVVIGGQVVGEIAGFDETHMPNHWNIIVKSKERKTGVEFGFELGNEVKIGE